MERFWEILISVNDEEFCCMLMVKAEKVKNIGYDKKTNLYILQVDKQLLYFDEPIVEIKEVQKIKNF